MCVKIDARQCLEFETVQTVGLVLNFVHAIYVFLAKVGNNIFVALHVYTIG